MGRFEDQELDRIPGRRKALRLDRLAGAAPAADGAVKRDLIFEGLALAKAWRPGRFRSLPG